MSAEIVEGKPSSSSEPTGIILGVHESSLKGYPHPSICSRSSFDWTVQKIVPSNTFDFNIVRKITTPSFFVVLGFEDMDCIFAMPKDFRDMEERDKK